MLIYCELYLALFRIYGYEYYILLLHIKMLVSKIHHVILMVLNISRLVSGRCVG